MMTIRTYFSFRMVGLFAFCSLENTDANLKRHNKAFGNTVIQQEKIYDRKNLS